MADLRARQVGFAVQPGAPAKPDGRDPTVHPESKVQQGPARQSAARLEIRLFVQSRTLSFRSLSANRNYWFAAVWPNPSFQRTAFGSR